MKTNIMFRVLSDGLKPHEITEALCLQPTEAYTKGDAYTLPKVGVRYRSIGHWSLCTTHAVASESVEEHARCILEQLEPRRAAISTLIADAKNRVAISVWWEIPEEHGVFALRSATMKRLCALCADIEIHFIGASA